MRAFPSATMVCRVLIGLDRADASGTLSLDGEGRSATISFEAGQVVAVNADRRIAISQPQALERVLRVCAWQGLALRLAQEPVQATWWKLGEPLAARKLALETMRSVLRSADLGTIRAELADAVYHLTPAGEQLLRGASLRPEEAAVLPWLRRGASFEEIRALPGCALPAYRFVWMLKLVRGVAPKAAASSYPLLLRKHRELRRHVAAHTLLDLPEGAEGKDARRALRKLVRHLHPDRFGDQAPPALRRASGEVVTALVEAEAKMTLRAAD